jgi:hypothetical protein
MGAKKPSQKARPYFALLTWVYNRNRRQTSTYPALSAIETVPAGFVELH